MSPLAALFAARHNAVPAMQWELALQQSLGLASLDLLRFSLAFFLSAIAGAVMRVIPSTKARHLYSFLSGLALVYYPFGSSCFHALPPALATWAVVRLVPRKCGTLAWLINFPYLLCLHAANASGVSWSSGALDFTGGQMVLTLKLIALAMCVQDAHRAAGAASAAAPAAAADGAAAGGGSPSKRASAAAAATTPPTPTTSVLTRYQAAHAIPCAPPLLDYLGYCFCFGNLLGGPFMEYSDYDQFAARQGVWSPTAKPRPAPLGAAYAQGFRAILQGLVCVGLFTLWDPTYNGRFFLSDWWAGASIRARVLGFMAVGTTVRMKYYFAWSFGEASCAFAGLDFVGWSDAPDAGGSGGGAAAAAAGASNGASGAAAAGEPKPIFGRCCNCDVLKVEFADSSRVTPAYWNSQTGVFLRRYVYERVTPPGRKPTFRTLLITQLVAGVWHGLYPGYFLFFASSALFFAHSTTLFNWERAGVVPARLVRAWPYRIAKILATKGCLDYAGSAFHVLTWRECIATYASVLYLPHFYMLAWVMLGRAFPVSSKKKAAAGEKAGGGAAAAAAAVAGKTKAA